MANEEGLRIGELLDITYSKLVERHNPQELTFQDATRSEIANDSDYHRTRIGYMCYESVGLFELDSEMWAIARGKKCGSYPGGQYVGDIIALDLVDGVKIGDFFFIKSDEIPEELTKEIRRGHYFLNTLFFGTDDGNIGSNETHYFDLPTRFGKRMSDLVGSRINEFVMQTPEYDKSMILASTFQHPTTQVMLYKPETPDFLADSIEQVLRETS